ncbi:WXG100 family type VII secretion target [Dactylosporangium sp. CA-092794]|uniref:WXG100 family type VII secretion target n=1 Tax=Dactylosporangium sp. CA-092794 TaxID=3239929 RepID=UPI003D928505
MDVKSLAMDLIGGIPQPPPGDPVRLRAAADLWTRAADGLQASTTEARGRVQTLAAPWTGVSRAAFDQQWDTLLNAAGHAAEEMHGLAGVLLRAADGIERAQRAYEVAMGAAVLTGLAGLIPAVVTFGESEVIALEAAVQELLVAVGIAEEAAATAAAAFGVAAQALREIVVYFTVDLAAQAGMSLVVDPGHNPLAYLDPGDAAQTALGMVGEPKPAGRRAHAEEAGDAATAAA